MSERLNKIKIKIKAKIKKKKSGKAKQVAYTQLLEQNLTATKSNPVKNRIVV